MVPRANTNTCSFAREALREQHPVWLGASLFGCAFECVDCSLYPAHLQFGSLLILAQLEERLAMFQTAAEEAPSPEHLVYIGIETIDLTEVPTTLGALHRSSGQRTLQICCFNEPRMP
jgi:hypothetical protein